jgi:hypothetical protein
MKTTGKASPMSPNWATGGGFLGRFPRALLGLFRGVWHDDVPKGLAGTVDAATLERLNGKVSRLSWQHLPVHGPEWSPTSGTGHLSL